MKRILPLAGAFVLMAGAITRAQDAQTPTTQPSRLDRLEQRVNQMESDLRSKDAEIEQLKSQLATRPAATETQPPTTQSSTDSALSDIDKTTQDIMKDISSKESAPPTLRFPANFNPNFAVIGDFAGNVSSDHSDPARNRFDLREVELDLRAAVDPRADAVVILPIDRSVSDPLFFNRNTPRDDSVDTAFDIEEAYINLHDFGVPNLTAKLGRFHMHFGRCPAWAQSCRRSELEWPLSQSIGGAGCGALAISQIAARFKRGLTEQTNETDWAGR